MRRVLRRLTYANVMSTIGVFLALTTGVALGDIQGTGRVKFGNRLDIPFVIDDGDVLNLPGVGRLEAACTPLPNLTDPLRVQFTNTSGFRMHVHTDLGGADPTFAILRNNEFTTLQSSAHDLMTWHIYRHSGADQPQATLITSSDETGDCDTSRVAVTAISSET